MTLSNSLESVWKHSSRLTKATYSHKLMDPQLGSLFQDASVEFLSLILRRNLSYTMLTLPFHALFYGKELKMMYIAFGNMNPGKPTCFSISLILDIYE